MEDIFEAKGRTPDESLRILEPFAVICDTRLDLLSDIAAKTKAPIMTVPFGPVVSYAWPIECATFA